MCQNDAYNVQYSPVFVCGVCVCVCVCVSCLRREQGGFYNVIIIISSLKLLCCSHQE